MWDRKKTGSLDACLALVLKMQLYCNPRYQFQELPWEFSKTVLTQLVESWFTRAKPRINTNLYHQPLESFAWHKTITF